MIGQKNEKNQPRMDTEQRSPQPKKASSLNRRDAMKTQRGTEMATRRHKKAQKGDGGLTEDDYAYYRSLGTASSPRRLRPEMWSAAALPSSMASSMPP